MIIGETIRYDNGGKSFKIATSYPFYLSNSTISMLVNDAV